MVYGSVADVKVVEGLMGAEEFRRVLYPDGLEGPEAGGFFGR